MAQCNDAPMSAPPDLKEIRKLMEQPGAWQPITVVPAPEIGKRLVVNADWSVRVEPVDEKIQAARQYIKDYEQWIIDHPKKTPPQEMIDRYKQEQLFVAKHVRL